MSRKRELSVGPTWAEQVALRRAAEELVDADDEAVEARAKVLDVDPRRLRSFIFDAKRRRG